MLTTLGFEAVRWNYNGPFLLISIYVDFLQKKVYNIDPRSLHKHYFKQKYKQYEKFQVRLANVASRDQCYKTFSLPGNEKGRFLSFL